MRLGVDVGGTFTDVVLQTSDDPACELVSAKVLTTSDSPELGVLSAVEAVLSRAGASADDLVGVIHGTTLATNALIERRGAFTAFVTTEGFRDVIETRTESRFDQYDINLTLPPPLVERRHRHVMRERIGADGGVLVPFDDTRARRLAYELADRGYESVAIGFLHSYLNPVHERRFRDILAEALPGAAVSISCEVAPQMRELERFNTVCANAYVQPVMASYLRRLRDGLRRLGASCPVLMIHSGGGLMSLESAAELPVRLVESGPAGGAIFAADIAARFGIDRVLSYDMGGTTAKICLIEDGTPRTAKTFEVARTARFTKGSGMSISIPVIEMIEIGAGGGSIAGVDVLGQIRVGPRSAGASPGPASYGRGGAEPTVTDADLVLGRLSADTFGAAEINLDERAARAAVSAGVGDRLGLDALGAAVGVSEIVDESMSNAARVHAVENGKHLERFTMVAFGGAAPAHAARLCSKLGIERLLIPPGAGVGSAIGFLRAAYSYEAVRSSFFRLDDFDASAVGAMLGELTSEAESFVIDACGGLGGPGSPVAVADGRLRGIKIERWAYMRYTGQGWEIPVELGSGPMDAASAEMLRIEFTKTYEEFFGRAIAGLAIEAVSWSVRASLARRPGEPTRLMESASADAAARSERRLFDTAAMSDSRALVVERAEVRPGRRVLGPAVIVEPQTTTVVPAGFEAVGQSDGCLLLRSGGLQPRA